MKTTITIQKEVDIRYIKVEVAVRYEEENIPNDFPLREGDTWVATIDIDNASIIAWPKGSVGRLSMKVCDEGTYTLFDQNFDEIKTLKNDYVPNSLLPGSYGDYIDLQIDEKGKITNWLASPNFSNFFGEDE